MKFKVGDTVRLLKGARSNIGEFELHLENELYVMDVRKDAVRLTYDSLTLWYKFNVNKGLIELVEKV